MIDYCEDDVCHSRFLLNYFDEKDARDCGKCEICLLPKHRIPAAKATEQAFAAIRTILSKPHFAAEITVPGIPASVISEVLQRMVQNGEVTIDNGRYILRN